MSNNDNLRDRNLLRLFLVLNVGLAGAFVAYLFLSRNNHPAVLPAHLSPRQRHRQNPPAPRTRRELQPQRRAPGSAGCAPKPALQRESGVRSRPDGGRVPSAPSSGVARRREREAITWEDVESAEYPIYIGRLRAAGCPEDKIRTIVSSDIHTLFDQRRLKEAMAHDIQWWRPQSDYFLSTALQEKGRRLEEQRRDLIRRLLGAEALELETKSLTSPSGARPAHRPGSRSLSLEKHARVQEICGKALDRQQSAVWAGVHDSQPMNNAEMARLREQTRADLRQVLNPLELEEFLLRYSHIAHYLRQELSGFEATPDEFSQNLRAVDALDHPMQLEFGGVETIERAATRALRASARDGHPGGPGPGTASGLPPYQRPLYRQAQVFASQQNAPPQALMPIYQLTKPRKPTPEDPY